MPKRKPKDPARSHDLPHKWIERHLERLEAFVYYDPINLTPWEYRRAHYLGPGEYEYLDSGWETIQLGDCWGGPDITAFFKKVIKIPDSHSGTDTALDIFMDGGETQLSIDGLPWQGLDWNRSIVPLGDFVEAKQEIELNMEAFIINYPYDDRRHDAREMHRFERARLIKINRVVETFLIDARLVLDAYLSYWRDESNFEIEGFLLHLLEKACYAIGPRITSQDQARERAVRAQEILRKNFFESKLYQSDGRINLHAHSHLDIIYLWPIKETFRKNCRTITNQLSLMREFPNYRFSYGQPFLYEKLKEMYPQVFEEVRQRVKDNRWEIVGAMYVEPDGNLLGAESLVRQIMFGKRFIREEFGFEVKTCWLIDVFGVMYTLPQVLRKSGVEYFITNKLTIWNDTNEFPYESFRWRGLDGSEVIAHFPPTHFAQKLEFDNLRNHWRNSREKQITGENLFIYGYGDGGGGPTREMVETSFRTKNIPGIPETVLESAEDFFHRLEKKGDQLPIWDDELYLEAHRGTYTSKSDLKRQNRKLELLYRDAEILSSIVWFYGGPQMQEELNKGWKLILLHQFHDSLPGTHGSEGWADINQDYITAFNIGDEVRDHALTFLVQHLSQEAADSNDLMIFNTLSWQRKVLIKTEIRDEAKAIQIEGSERLPVQHYQGHTYFQAPNLPSLGWTLAAFDKKATGESQETARFTDNVIETQFYRIKFDSSGNLERIFDKVNKHEVLSAPGNQFQVFEDDPGYKFNAWDIAYHFEEYQYPVIQTTPWQLIANGPLFAVFTSCWEVLNSTIEQEMWLYADDSHITFHTRVSWNDQQKLLKVAFPLCVRTRTATFDLPFGNIERATHRNTSWEQAKFEVYAHKWVDLSEGDYGVALLNDCKYGHDVRENILRLSLLRSPVHPDKESDQGTHEFSYALSPHAGNWRQAQVDRCAYEFNIPALVVKTNKDKNNLRPSIPGSQSFLDLDSPSVIVETLKQSENGDGVILRTFDSHGCHQRSLFSFPTKLNEAFETDLLEESPQAIVLANSNSLISQYVPYEIKTHRLVFTDIENSEEN